MNKYSAMMFTVRPGILLRLLFDMYGILALLTLVPFLVAAFTNSVSTNAYLLVIGLLTVCWLIGRFMPAAEDIQRNEALAMVAMLFISASLLFSIPVMTYGVSFLDAWFEAVSGVTTTGLSTLSVVDMPTALLFGRGWMQWLGGVGVVVLALAMFLRPGHASSQLGFSDREKDELVGGTRAHAKRVVIIYLLLTTLGIVALYLAGASLLDSIVHSMTAVSTGGFANYADSLGSVTASQLTIVNILCVAGAISFHVYYRSLLVSRGRFAGDNQLYALLGVILLVSSAVWLLSNLTSLDLRFADILTLVVSSQTTAGFSPIAVAGLPGWLLLMLCLCMAIGGGIGSTSGGLKLSRFIMMLRMARLALTRSALSENVLLARDSSGARIDAEEMGDVLALLTWFLIALLTSWMAFLVYGYPPAESLFEVTSALATAGLSTGITNESLPAVLKFVLCCNMLLGRVEILAILILLSPHSWIGKRRKAG
ncbi:MAG: potassium transporter TrkG [Porticoccus sp.]|nr:potassium transporter TrkG [Porticoccus sp.]